MLKKIAYANIIYGVTTLGAYLTLHRSYRDYFFVSGLALAIWYHWETLKQLNSQRNKLDKINYVIGILLLPFTGILAFHGLYLIKADDDFDKVRFFLGAPETIFFPY